MTALRSAGKQHELSERISGIFTIDFNSAATDPAKARVHVLAQNIDILALFDELTSRDHLDP